MLGLRGQVLCHEFMVETRHHGLWFVGFGWNFQLSIENHWNSAFLRNFWRIRPLHSALGYGRHYVSTRWSAFFPSAKGQTWESTISMDLRIQDHHESHTIIWFTGFYSCSLQMLFTNLLLIPTFHWNHDHLMFLSKFDLSGRGGAHFLLGRLFQNQFWAQLPDPVQQGDSWGRPKAQRSSKMVEEIR